MNPLVQRHAFCFMTRRLGTTVPFPMNGPMYIDFHNIHKCKKCDLMANADLLTRKQIRCRDTWSTSFYLELLGNELKQSNETRHAKNLPIHFHRSNRSACHYCRDRHSRVNSLCRGFEFHVDRFSISEMKIMGAAYIRRAGA